MRQGAVHGDGLLERELLQAVAAGLPDGEKIKQCIQCGTCSGACPTSSEMDYTPRQVIAALRAGALETVLYGNTIWMCSSCYGCTVRCPVGIKLTDVMYQLKALALKHGITRPRSPGVALQRAFVAEVDAHGRSEEVGLMRRFFLGTSPLNGLKNLGLAAAMYRRGRLRLRGTRLTAEGQRQLRAISRGAKGE